MEAAITDNKQSEKPWLFKPGQSGNPNGRPKGSVSIIGRIKQIFEDNPEIFETYVIDVMSDKNMRKEVVQHIDGKPKEQIELSGPNGGAIQVQTISFDDYDSPQPQAEQGQG